MSKTHGTLLVALSALVLLLSSAVGWCADAEVRDDDNHISFVPTVEFCGDVLENGLFISTGLLHSDFQYKLGEPVNLLVAMHNVSMEPRQSWVCIVSHYYEVQVIDQKGNPVPLTSVGKRAISGANYDTRSFSMTLQPGQGFTETYPLSTYYEMSRPGIYKIIVTREMNWPLMTSKSGDHPSWLKHEVGPINIIVGEASPEAIKRVRLANLKLGGHTPAAPPDKPLEKPTPGGPVVYAKYDSTADSKYRHMQLIGTRLIVIYLPASFKFHQSEEREPQYGPRDLKHVEVLLSEPEVNEFVKLMKSTAFLRLDRHYGTADAVPYSTTEITVSIDGKTTAVEYHRSMPRSTLIPAAFGDVRDWFLNTAAAKIADFAKNSSIIQ